MYHLSFQLYPFYFLQTGFLNLLYILKFNFSCIPQEIVHVYLHIYKKNDRTDTHNFSSKLTYK